MRAALIAGFAALVTAAPAQADTWTVTNGSSDASRPACNTVTHTCVSLRTAIAASEATRHVPDTIHVPAGTIHIGDDLEIESEIAVVGVSARSSIIDGGGEHRGFRVSADGDAKLSHLTIRNGAGAHAHGLGGGGILNLGGTVALSYVRVTGSRALRGGGVANVRGSLTVDHSLIDANASKLDGGGIANIGGHAWSDPAVLKLADSTVRGNTGEHGAAGGIASRDGGSVLQITRSTIADNAGGHRGGIGGLAVKDASRASVSSSIVARNTSEGVTSNCGAVKPADGGGNVENGRGCGFSLGGVDPGLASGLSNAGGELDVLALLPGSPAIDRAAAGACGAGTTDQRGLARPQGGACDAGAFELDQAPTVTIGSGPAGTINRSSASFAFSTLEPGVAYECRLTGPGRPGTFAPCDTPGGQSYGGLANGSYQFSVRAMDGVFADPPTASRSFTVALLDTAITGGPTGPTNLRTPTFTFTGVNGAAGFQCRVDAAEFASCRSPFSPSELAEGTHTFSVRAVDAAGNVDETPAVHTVVIDLTPPPAPTVESGPAGPTTESSPAFAFSATESVSCRLDGPGALTGEFGPCASPKRFAGLPPGDYVFIVRAVDAAGNANETRRAFTVTVPRRAQPTPTATPTPTPTPQPPPPAETVVAAPTTGTVLVRLPGTRTFIRLDASRGIPFGSEVDARDGKVTLTALPVAGRPPETADFFGGLFKLRKAGRHVELRLSQKLTGCPTARSGGANAAQRKPRSRKLWGDGRGKFRTRGKYSSATVRGTRWLVQDTCTLTLTRVTRGVVSVKDFGKKKTVLVKANKRYTARPKRR